MIAESRTLIRFAQRSLIIPNDKASLCWGIPNKLLSTFKSNASTLLTLKNMNFLRTVSFRKKK